MSRKVLVLEAGSSQPWAVALRRMALALSAMAVCACGSQTSDEEPALEGGRYKVTLVRGADTDEWVANKGAMEWFFFKGGVFRQIGQDYVEPQFYGENQACNGTASGAWADVPLAEGAEARPEREKPITLTYDGTRDVRGLCRMTDRQITIYLQPSGVFDLLDNRRVQRLELMEKIR